MKRSLLQRLPSAEPIDRNLDDPRERPLVAFEGYTVAEWSPGRVSEDVPPTEVHLLIPVPGLKFGLRLKSASPVDELVGVLLEHRKNVWGPR
jgi:hypothetical protein